MQSSSLKSYHEERSRIEDIFFKSLEQQQENGLLEEFNDEQCFTNFSKNGEDI